MSFLLAPALVPLLFFLPGYLFSRLFFRSPYNPWAGERLFIPVAASVCLTTWLGLLLAEVGAFSLLNLSAIVLLGCAATWVFTRKKLTHWSWRDAKPDWIFLATLALAILLFAHPAEYVLGNSDAGTYVNTGAIIARTGAIADHDAQVAQLAPDLAKTFYWQLVNPYMLYTQVRLPGFFIADQAQGLVLPQFLHLYPVWLAIWDSLLGVQVGLYATPLIALLGATAFYFLARELFGKNVARLSCFLLVVSVPQFWFARYPVAESMTQFLVLTGMYALLLLKSPSAPTVTGRRDLSSAVLASLAFGELFLVRSDSILFLVPLVLYALVLIFLRKWRREHWVLFGVLGVVLVHAVAHMLLFAPNYLYFQYSHALRLNSIDKLLKIDFPAAQTVFTRVDYWLVLLGVLALGMGALLIIDRIFQQLRARWAKNFAAGIVSATPFIRFGGALLIVGFVVAFYCILPRPETWYAYVGGLTPLRSEANLIKLGWYLSPIGIALATVGAAIVMLRDLNERNLFFFGTAALFTLLYIQELYSTPHYIYTMRHYIPLVIPLFILCAARALQWLWDRAPRAFSGLQSARPLRWAALGAFALWMLYNVYAMGLVDASRAQGLAFRLPFVSETIALGMVRIEPFEKSIVGVSELGGAYSQVEGLAQQIDPNAVILFSAGRDEPAAIATPLKYIFRRDAFVTVFNNPPGDKIAALIDAWRARGREVILAFGTNGGKLQLPKYELQPVGDASLNVPQWAFAYEYMPRNAWRVNLNYALFRAVPRRAPEAYPFTLNFGGADFPYLVRGFLERSPESTTRWIGGILADNKKLRGAKSVSGTVRIPVPDNSSRNLNLTLRARAPRDNVHLEIKQGKQTLGKITLSQTMDTYTVKLKNTKLDSGTEGYWLELSSDATPDGEGRVLGAELEMLQLNR